MLRNFLAVAIRRGSLEVVDAAGAVHRFGQPSRAPIRVRFTNEKAERRVTHDPDMNLGEEFVEGGFIVEQGSIYDFMLLVATNVDGVTPPWPVIGITALRGLAAPFRQFNTPGRARRNVHSHYDLDGRLYALFLDRDWQYSCAYFEEGVTDLDEAQLAKKRHIAGKLALATGQSVLDVGSGWGGMAIYLAEHFNVDVTGITLSEEQLAVSNQRVVERGLSGRVRFLLKDYRRLEGRFDRIVSVGMFEHVGFTHFRTFFNTCRRLLVEDGAMLLHTIGRRDPPSRAGSWVTRHIFPGGHIPSLSEIAPAIEKSGLMVTDIEILRLHYAKTLRLWRERFMARRKEALALYDERFCRLWEYYLAISEVYFRVGALVNFQIQMSRAMESLPRTRDYMFATEDALRD